MGCTVMLMHKKQADLAMKYNYVFFFANYDYWEAIIGQEVYNSPYVHVYKGAFNGHPFLQKIFKLHWSYRINRIINLPFKSLWFKLMYNQKFVNDLPLCFVYVGGNHLYRDGGFTEYVRRMNARNRQVIMHNDLITKKCSYDYHIIRDKVDLAITYDYDEAQKFGIHYFREDTYSRLINLPAKVDYESDVYFLGAAKDRLNQIIKTYSHLRGNGVKCLFLIAGVPQNEQIEGEGLQYIEGISYRENLEHIVKTKCILEIIQNGSADITTRAVEAIAYQRRLLTNCKSIPDGYFHQTQICIFDNPQEISISFFKQGFRQEDYPPLIDLNPLRRLYDIQEQLEKKEQQR